MSTAGTPRPARAAATGRAALSAMAVLIASGVLAGCGGTLSSDAAKDVPGTAAPAGVSRSASPAAQSPGTGCAPGGLDVPPDANQVSTDDLDGDGQNDTLWLGHRSGQRLLGVATASGARFSVAVNNADLAESQQRVGDTVSALAGRLGDGTAVILLDVGRATVLYAVAGCRVVPTRNVQGEPYTFDMGYAGTGNGVGCVSVDGALALVGYLAEYRPPTYQVTRTTVTVSSDGERATNGRSVVLADRAPETGALVKRATSLSCGTSRTVPEPES